MELLNFTDVSVVTLDDLKNSKLQYGKPLGYAVEGCKFLLTDFVGRFPCRNQKDGTYCVIAIKENGNPFPISFSALTRWGYNNEPTSESAPTENRVGMFENTKYSDLFANQLVFSGKVIDATAEQTLFVPKYDKERKSFGAPYASGVYQLCKITNEQPNAEQTKTIQDLLGQGFVSCLGKFKKEGE